MDVASFAVLVGVPDRDESLAIFVRIVVILVAGLVIIWPLVLVEIGKRRGNLPIMLGGLGAFFDPKPYLPGGSQYRGPRAADGEGTPAANACDAECGSDRTPHETETR